MKKSRISFNKWCVASAQWLHNHKNRWLSLSIVITAVAFTLAASPLQAATGSVTLFEENTHDIEIKDLNKWYKYTITLSTYLDEVFLNDTGFAANDFHLRVFFPGSFDRDDWPGTITSDDIWGDSDDAFFVTRDSLDGVEWVWEPTIGMELLSGERAHLKLNNFGTIKRFDLMLTPEPATIMLFGLGGLALRRKRRV